jgi:hypothetical protein
MYMSYLQKPLYHCGNISPSPHRQITDTSDSSFSSQLPDGLLSVAMSHCHQRKIHENSSASSGLVILATMLLLLLLPKHLVVATLKIMSKHADTSCRSC